MNTAQTIHRHIQQIPYGKPFTVASFRDLASYANARQILSRLVKARKLTKVTRGMFVRPKDIPYIGPVLPSTEEIIKTISNTTGEIIAIHGAEAARLFQLTTQVPLHPVFYTTGTSRRIKVGTLDIILKHISPHKLIKPGTTAGLVLSALGYLGKTHVNLNIIQKIQQQLTQAQFAEVLQCLPQMPAWLAELFYHYNRDTHDR